MDTTVQQQHLSDVREPEPTVWEGTIDISSDTDRQEEVLVRGQRKKEASARLRDYVTHTIRKKSLFTSSPPVSMHSSGTPYPIAHYVNCDNFFVRHRNFLTALEVEREPVTYAEAVKDGSWRDAMRYEIKALKANRTWIMEDLPTGKKTLECKWVYKIKYNYDGTVEQLKVRLVILVNHQTEGVDYTETFAPVAKWLPYRSSSQLLLL